MREIITLKDGTVLKFEDVFNKYNNMLYGYCWKIVKREDVAEDCTSVVFQQIWERKFELTDLEHLVDLAFKVAKHRCIDHLRHQKRYDKIKEIVNNDKEEEQLRFNSDIISSLYKYIESFEDRRMREAVYYFLVEGRKPREIAKECRLPIKTVYEVIERGINRIRSKFKQYKHLIYE